MQCPGTCEGYWISGYPVLGLSCFSLKKHIALFLSRKLTLSSCIALVNSAVVGLVGADDPTDGRTRFPTQTWATQSEVDEVRLHDDFMIKTRQRFFKIDPL